MTNKYLDVSATYNGDGTSSSPATSDGSTGAWNDALNAIKGSPAYGSITAGDTIHIRSNDGVTDLGITVTDNFTAIGGTLESPITFLVDDGTIWASSGAFTISVSGDYYPTFPDFCIFDGKVKNGFVLNHLTVSVDSRALNGNHSVLRNFLIRNPISLSTNQFSITSIASGKLVYFDNIDFEIGSWYSGYSRCLFYPVTYGSGFKMRECTLNFVNPNRNNSLLIFRSIREGKLTIECDGFNIINAFPALSLFQLSVDMQAKVHITNFTYDNEDMSLYPYEWNLAETPSLCDLKISGINGECFDFFEFNGKGVIEWRKGTFYPTLNAVLPDGVYWSIKVHPFLCSESAPMVISKINKLYNDLPATKTLSVELLISQNYLSLTKDKWWVNISYIDVNGIARSDSTYDPDGSALTTSDAGWSLTSYGAIGYDKYSISTTTEYPIKQNSIIKVEIITAEKSPSANDFYFIDPNVEII